MKILKTNSSILNVLVIAGLLLSNLAWGPAGAYSAPTEGPVQTTGVILYVKPGGTGSCSGWTDACDLQDALDVVGTGDQVWVAKGVYMPTKETFPGIPSTATFQLVNGVAMYGGFPDAGTPGWGARNWVSNPTVLSGDIGETGNASDNSETVVTAIGIGETTILDGFTITGGNSHYHGGGMRNYQSSPTLTNLIFSDNQASWSGGGMYNNESSPTLTNVIFSGNLATWSGGGMYNFMGSNPTLTNVSFFNNEAEAGGGLANNPDDLTDVGQPTLTNVIFSGNSATLSGGGMYNVKSNPTLTDVIFYNNRAVSGKGGGMSNYSNTPTLINVLFSGNSANTDGGGMYNFFYSSPTLTNVTLFGNSAGTNGGGIYNDWNSSPNIHNAILWKNASNQIFNQGESIPNITYSIIESGCPSGSHCSEVINADPQFVDAASGNLRLKSTSPAIDAGNNAVLPTGLTTDLDGKARFFADQEQDGQPDNDARVDLGAYEAQEHTWYIRYAGPKLEAGRAYRLGFHADIAPTTVADTLAAYKFGNSQGSLSKAKKAYELALLYAETDPEIRQAVLGLQDTIWERVTGSMLMGSDELAKALDLTDAEDIDSEITALIKAIEHTGQARDGYLELLAGPYSLYFLDNQPERVDPISGNETPNLDVIRLAMAVAKKSRAYLELADRQFRKGDQNQARQTLLEGKGQAVVELALLEALWEGVAAETSYQEITRNMSDMDRMNTFIVDGKNPLGYSADFIPFYYKPGSLNNNYEETKIKANESLVLSRGMINEAKAQSKLVDDNFALMESRYKDTIERYNDELVNYCGLNSKNEIDLDLCMGGEIYRQILALQGAYLRTDQVLKEMEKLSQQIQIQVNARAKAAGIYSATAALIDPKTSKEYISMVEQEQNLNTAQTFWKYYSGHVNSTLDGAGKGGSFGPYGALAGGLWGAVDNLANVTGLAPKETPKEEKLLKFQAWQEAQVLICDGKIKDLEFETRIKELFLGFGLLDIDLLIANNNLQQEVVKLKGMKTRVEYLLAERAKADAFTRLLYRDPAHRVLRDYYMELAHNNYGITLDYAYQAGQALEYETNLQYSEISAPNPDALIGIRNINTLSSRLADMQHSYTTWSQGKVPVDYTDTVSLSRALGFEDMEIPGIGWVTREEQFNAYVRDPANRIDLDNDGFKESLTFNFYTSIHKGNPFFLTSLFNDRIKTVKVRVRGTNLGKDGVYVDLVWGGKHCGTSSCGTAILRAENAFRFGGEDDLRAYSLPSRTVVAKAAAGSNPFPLDAENAGLAWLSVANSSWTLTIDLTQGQNKGFNLDNIDEIELTIKHNAYALQHSLLNSQDHQPLPSRPYEPMQNEIESSLLSPSFPENPSSYLTAITSAGSLTGSYVGIVIPTSPSRMPTINLGLVLTEIEGSTLSGFLDGLRGVHFPMTDPINKRGPQVTGQRIGATFILQSEPFTINLGNDITVTRQVFFETGAVSETGETLQGSYRETLAGLTPEPIEITGEFSLNRPTSELAPIANFGALPVTGVPPLAVQFNDLSSSHPTGWEWSFGDGTTSYEQHPTHIYTKEGAYTVSLTVHNQYGSDTRTDIGRISVSFHRVYLPLLNR